MPALKYESEKIGIYVTCGSRTYQYNLQDDVEGVYDCEGSVGFAMNIGEEMI